MSASRVPLRWVVVGVFVLSSSLNYLDRMVLAALAPLVQGEFQLTNADYGKILSLFSIVYALSSPVAGLFLDRFGLNRGISIAVAFWSAAAVARGFVTGLPGLLAASAALGMGESAGIPSTGKAAHIYLEPKERALGAALSQIGLSIGSIVAPPLATWLALRYGWRAAFIVTGALGFLWIPVWLFTSRRAPAMRTQEQGTKFEVRDILRDRMLWGFVCANILAMTVYTLWTNWTTIYLQKVHHLPLVEANWLAPIPHFFAYFGALAGGWLSFRAMSRGMEALDARRRACKIAAASMLVTALVPLAPTPIWAVIGISASFFWASAWGVNLYTMPVDAYGAARSAFGVSMLTFAYGIMQTVASPLIGGMIDRYGFAPVCYGVALLPLAGYGIVARTRR